MGRASSFLGGVVAAALLTACSALLGVDLDQAHPASSDASSTPDVGSETDSSASGDIGRPPDGDAAADASDGDASSPDSSPCTGKTCAGQCVSLDDPLHGCAATSCAPCALPHSAAASCSAGACAVASCAAGYADCNQVAADGCEVDLTSTHDHCGTCATACSAAMVCSQGVCGVTCGSLSNCAGSCVDETTDPAHCGSCTNACTAPPQAMATCASSVCGFQCNAGYHTCGSACADDTSTASCGGSCTPCQAPQNGSATCASGQCGVACNPGFAVCGAACCAVTDGGCGNTQTDPLNCGSCGHSCQGGACNAGVCQPVVLASGGAPIGIAVDATNVYWGDSGTGAVWRCAVGGCNDAPTQIASAGSGPVQGVAIDSSSVYWTTSAALYKCPLGGCGGSPTLLLSGLMGDAGISGGWDIAVDSTSVYLAIHQPVGAVQKCATAGCNGSPTTLASGAAQDWPSGIAVSGGNVYWTLEGKPAAANGAVLTCSVAGCATPTTLVAGLGVPTGIAVDATSYYAVSNYTGNVKKGDMHGGTVGNLATGQAGPYRIAVDSTNAYWTNYGGSPGTVMKCAIAGCGMAPTTLATNQTNPRNIALDATSVYWTTSNSVMKVAK